MASPSQWLRFCFPPPACFPGGGGGGGRGGVERHEPKKLLVSKPNMAMRTHMHTHKCHSAMEQHDWSWDKHLCHCQGPSRKTQAYAKGIRGAQDLGLNSASQLKKLWRGALRQKRLCPTSNICYAFLSPQSPTYHPFSMHFHHSVVTGGSGSQTCLHSVSGCESVHVKS